MTLQTLKCRIEERTETKHSEWVGKEHRQRQCKNKQTAESEKEH